MSCILRVYGDNLELAPLLTELRTLTPDTTWLKGEQPPHHKKPYPNSGASFLASDRDLDEVEEKLAETRQFLADHLADIQRLSATPGVDEITLDVGVALNEGNVAQFTYFPPELVKLAAEANIGLEVSLYLCSNE